MTLQVREHDKLRNPAGQHEQRSGVLAPGPGIEHGIDGAQVSGRRAQLRGEPGQLRFAAS